MLFNESCFNKFHCGNIKPCVRSLAFLLIFMLIAPRLFSDDDVQSDVANAPNALDKSFYNKKSVASGFVAATEIVGFNILLNAVDSIVFDFDFADITTHTMWKHLSQNLWEFDDNGFPINQLGHPYMGSLFFNAARANGFNFYESLAFAAGGSLFWEEFMETSNPSVNDMIATPISGAILGEVMHRLFLATNWRLLPLTMFISPMDAFNRFVTGKRAPPVSGRIEKIELFAGLDFFARRTEFRSGADDKQKLSFPAFSTGAKIYYGDRYGHDTKEPFDVFTADARAAIAVNGQYDVKLFVDGMLFAFSPWKWLSAFSTVSVNAMYDVILSRDIYYSTPRVGIGVTQLFSPAGCAWQISWDASVGWSILATVENHYYIEKLRHYDDGKKRTYDFYTGVFAKLGFDAKNDNFGNFHAGVTADFLFYVQKKNRDFRGTAFVQCAEFRWEHKVWNNVYLGIADFLYHKWNVYGGAGNVEFISNQAQFYTKVEL